MCRLSTPQRQPPRVLDAQLRKAGLVTRTEGGAGTIRLLATDGRERFAGRVGSRFLKRPISPDEVELVDL